MFEIFKWIRMYIVIVVIILSVVLIGCMYNINDL